MSNRVAELASKIPLVTVSLLFLNVGIHGMVFMFNLPTHKLAISAAQILNGEFYRIITSTFTHGGIMHIFMNMSSLLQLGASLETQFGSMQFLFLTFWSTFLIGGCYVLLSCIFALMLRDMRQLQSSGVGFSGVLFCYAVLEANHTTETSRSFYGMFNVPAKLMPFLLLVVLQVIIPNVSMLGHLSGVIIGLLSLSNCMALFMPTDAFFEYLELEVPFVKNLSKMTAYVRCRNKSFIISSNSSSGSCFDSLACTGIVYVLTQIWNLIAVVLHIIGFPTDRCCAFLSKGMTSVLGIISSLLCCFRRSPPLPVTIQDNGLENRGRTLGDQGGYNRQGEGRGRPGGDIGMGSMPTGGGTGSTPKPARGVYAPVTAEEV